MKVLTLNDLDTPIHFLPLRENVPMEERGRNANAYGRLDKSRIPSVPPDYGRFLICNEYFTWLPCEQASVNKQLKMEKLLIAREVKSKIVVFSGAARAFDSNRPSLAFPPLDGEALELLQVFLYRAFGRHQAALHSEAATMRRKNPKTTSGEERLGTFNEIFEVIETGRLNGLF